MARARKALESSVEGYLEDRCKDLCVMVIKNTGLRGIPDRLLIYHGIHWFVELKRPGEEPSELQQAIARKLRSHGAVAICADCKPDVDRLLDALVAHRDAPRRMAARMVGLDYGGIDPDL